MFSVNISWMINPKPMTIAWKNIDRIPMNRTWKKKNQNNI